MNSSHWLSKIGITLILFSSILMSSEASDVGLDFAASHSEGLVKIPQPSAESSKQKRIELGEDQSQSPSKSLLMIDAPNGFDLEEWDWCGTPWPGQPLPIFDEARPTR